MSIEKDNNITHNLQKFNERLSFFRKTIRNDGKKTTQEDMAKILGVTRKTYQNYEDGKTYPESNQLNLLNIIHHVNLNWLVCGYGEMIEGKKEESPFAVEESAGTYNNVWHKEFVLIGKSSAQINAGKGAPESELHEITEYLAFKKSWLRTHVNAAPHDLLLVEVIGDSMFPTLCPYDLLLVDLRQRAITYHAIYVLRYDGTLIAKRVNRTMRGQIEIISDNAERYPKEIFDPENESRIDVLGRVVWVCRMM